MKKLAIAVVSLAIAGVVAPAEAFHPMNQSHGYQMPKKWKRGQARTQPSIAASRKKRSRAAALAAGVKPSKRKAQLAGGARPSISASKPSTVRFSGYSKGSIVIDTAGRRLYYVLGGGRAYAYPVAVGKRGFTWSGTKRITAKRAWPDWRPPAEMRKRKPHLPVHMKGGVNNPLGAMALYLGSSLYRIHGTNDNSSIGQAVSSGCIRMRNSHVVHLARLAGVGTQVHVLKRLPRSIAAKADSRQQG